ncbi:Uncharacterized protein PBTT_02758 [Plasmodiophora brassicae]|nr:hypothetical protein PBRA_008978 [Plasmodiophora brassicae]
MAEMVNVRVASGGTVTPRPVKWYRRPMGLAVLVVLAVAVSLLFYVLLSPRPGNAYLRFSRRSPGKFDVLLPDKDPITVHVTTEPKHAYLKFLLPDTKDGPDVWFRVGDRELVESLPFRVNLQSGRAQMSGKIDEGTRDEGFVNVFVMDRADRELNTWQIKHAIQSNEHLAFVFRSLSYVLSDPDKHRALFSSSWSKSPSLPKALTFTTYWFSAGGTVRDASGNNVAHVEKRDDELRLISNVDGRPRALLKRSSVGDVFAYRDSGNLGAPLFFVNLKRMSDISAVPWWWWCTVTKPKGAVVWEADVRSVLQSKHVPDIAAVPRDLAVLIKAILHTPF